MWNNQYFRAESPQTFPLILYTFLMKALTTLVISKRNDDSVSVEELDWSGL